MPEIGAHLWRIFLEGGRKSHYWADAIRFSVMGDLILYNEHDTSHHFVAIFKRMNWETCVRLDKKTMRPLGFEDIDET